MKIVTKKHSFIGLIVASTLFVGISHAQDFAKGNKIDSENFTGEAWLDRVAPPDDANPVYVGNVTFAPGARTNWHSHPTGQILLVLKGEGYYQEKGSAKRILRKGDTVKCPPDVVHWHGATEKNEMMHAAISSKSETPVRWLAPVSDEEYHHKIKEE